MRSKIDDGPEGLSIVIPVRRQFFPLVFLPLWLVGWAVGAVSATRDLLSGQDRSLFLVVWLAAWMLGGAFAVLSWLWILAGRERVTAGLGTFVHRYELFGLARTREFDVSQMRNMRVAHEPVNAWTGGNMRALGWGGGTVAFDYGAKTVRFAPVDEAEASIIVNHLAKRLHLAQAPRPGSPEEPVVEAPEAGTFWGRD
jgi:hypothetical protein